MRRIDGRHWLLICYTVSLLWALPDSPICAAEQPNIVFIFADDQAYDTVAALGNTEIRTPNLDRLTKSGLTFTHAYNMGSWSGAVCVASRTMLNTGRYLWKANEVYQETEKLRREGKLWSEEMKKAGYKTYFTGKWHVRADAKKAFDVAGHIRGGMPKQTPGGYNRPILGQPDVWSPFDVNVGGFWEGGKHWSEVVGDDAVGFLKDASSQEQPFFMYLAFNAPHDPRQAPKEYVDMYPADKIIVPDSFVDLYPHREAMGSGESLRDEKLAPFPRTTHAIQVHRQEYYAIITHMDRQIGRILDAVRDSGKADNTYIVFSADHGLACGRHGLLGKQNLFDHSVRVPLVIAGPDVPKNKRIRGDVYLQDIMPSTLEWAHAELPDYVDFHSLLPIISGQRDCNYHSIYGGYLELQRSVTMDHHKLILYPKSKTVLLYDLKDDPQELVDLSADKKQMSRMKELFAELLVLQGQVGDKLDLKTTYEELAAK
jgi:arylsulfatase A-like enzyme